MIHSILNGHFVAYRRETMFKVLSPLRTQVHPVELEPNLPEPAQEPTALPSDAADLGRGVH